MKRNSLIQQTRQNLNKLVYDYFGVCEWERYLIEDTEKVFHPSSTPHTLDSDNLLTAQPSTPADREVYASALVSTFRGWTRTKANLWAESCIAPKSGLAFVTFGVGGRAKDFKETKAEKRVEELLKKIRASSAHSEGTVFHCLRGFVFYEGLKAHLLKPLNRRHWTRTAALNDADEILVHMMEGEGWGV
jgi:hypothetical protein